jgi:alpha/beta superfamily hydrolase
MTAFDFGSAFVVRYVLHHREAEGLAASRRPACHDGDRNAYEKDVRADEIQ